LRGREEGILLKKTGHPFEVKDLLVHRFLEGKRSGFLKKIFNRPASEKLFDVKKGGGKGVPGTQEILLNSKERARGKYPKRKEKSAAGRKKKTPDRSG